MAKKKTVKEEPKEAPKKVVLIDAHVCTSGFELIIDDVKHTKKSGPFKCDADLLQAYPQDLQKYVAPPEPPKDEEE